MAIEPCIALSVVVAYTPSPGRPEVQILIPAFLLVHWAPFLRHVDSSVGAGAKGLGDQSEAGEMDGDRLASAFEGEGAPL